MNELKPRVDLDLGLPRMVPIFVGKSKDGTKVVIYSCINGTLFVRIDDGETWTISPGSDIELWNEMETSLFHMRLVSPEWTGDATGSRRDLIEEPIVYLN